MIVVENQNLNIFRIIDYYSISILLNWCIKKAFKVLSKHIFEFGILIITLKITEKTQLNHRIFTLNIYRYLLPLMIIFNANV